jgi:hypothetical protein
VTLGVRIILDVVAGNMANTFCVLFLKNSLLFLMWPRLVLFLAFGDLISVILVVPSVMSL